METQSRTDAHKVFADLYRKPRSPEHQEKVDQIIQKSNDVFIRIDLIRKLDEDYQKEQREKAQALEEQRRKEEQPSRRPAKASSQSSRPATPKREADNSAPGLGFLTSLFGVNNNISKFARESGTIELGFLGRKMNISDRVERLFKGLREDQIIPTLQALRMSEQQGWRVWNPLIYNVILNFSKFFNSFISLDSLFIDQISPEIFLNRSTKMQMYYARLLSREDSKDIILENVPEMVRKDEKLANRMNMIVSGLNFGLSLEASKPKLTDIIRSFYIVTNKKMISWEEILELLNVPPIQETKFQAPPEILKEVETTLMRLADDITVRINQKEEVESLKGRYFKIDQTGKVQFEFLNGIVEDYFQHHFPENMQTDSLKSSYKSTPHRLLFLLLRDFQSVYTPALEGMVKIGSKGQSRDVIIVQPGLFRAEIEGINASLRELEAFNKKYPSFQFSFKTFNSSSAREVEDQITTKLFQLLFEIADFMGKFADRMNVIIDNHTLAKQYEAKNQLNERGIASKEAAIEDTKILHRFIPYYDKAFVTNSRINGRSVEDVFMEMTRLLYNYAIIYKDRNTMNKLRINRKIDNELDQLHAEYKRLAGKPFQESRIQQ